MYAVTTCVLISARAGNLLLSQRLDRSGPARRFGAISPAACDVADGAGRDGTPAEPRGDAAVGPQRRTQVVIFKITLQFLKLNV